MLIVGVAGRAQHGKDTVGGVLRQEFGFYVMKFAGALRELLAAVNPVLSCGEVRGMSLEWVLEHGDWDTAKAHPEVRRMLQDLGTCARSIIGEDVWIRALERRLADAETAGIERVVITDVRFTNEAEWVHAQGGEVWLVVRTNPGGSVAEVISSAHPSEREALTLPYDRLLVAQSGEVDHLREEARAAARALLDEHR